MRDKLRHKMAYEIANNCFPTPPHEQGWAYKIADSILALINEERCEWTYADHNECWNSACGMEMFEPEPSKFQFDRYPYCPCCGRKIKVKDS
jgi:hypothetical protein